MAEFVEAVFHDHKTKRNVSGRVALPATGGGSVNAARIACQNYAWDNGFTHWAHFENNLDAWQVFECKGRSSRIFLTHMPTKAAAEMWLVHRG